MCWSVHSTYESNNSFLDDVVIRCLYIQAPYTYVMWMQKMYVVGTAVSLLCCVKFLVES
jgi:hypothetical protein